MAVNVTLAQLRSEILARVDDASSGYFSASDVNTQINRSGRQLVSKLASQAGVRHKVCRGTVTTAVGTARYAWPTTDTWTSETGLSLIQLLGVTIEFGPQQRQRIGRMAWNNRERYTNSSASWTYGADIAYEYNPDAILFFPPPNRVVTVEVLYVPAWKDLSSDSDTYNGISGFDTWLVCNVCAQLAAKESDSEQIGFYVSERDAVWSDMLALAQTTDEGDAGVMVDMEGWGANAIDPDAVGW